MLWDLAIAMLFFEIEQFLKSQFPFRTVPDLPRKACEERERGGMEYELIGVRKTGDTSTTTKVPKATAASQPVTTHAPRRSSFSRRS